MLFIQNVQLLVEANSEAEADELIKQCLVQPQILDSSIEGTELAADELVDSITNNTYTQGDFCQGWVVFSPRVQDQFGQENAYRSEQHGWVSKDLATRYPPYQALINECRSHVGDSVMLLASSL